MRSMQISGERLPSGTGEAPPFALTLRRWQWAALVSISGLFLFLHVRFSKGELNEIAHTLPSAKEDVVLSELGKASRQQLCDLAAFKADWRQWPVVSATDLLMPLPKAVHYNLSHAAQAVRMTLSTSVKFSFPHLTNDLQLQQLRHSITTFCSNSAGLIHQHGISTLVEVTIAENSVYDDMHEACTLRGQEAFNVTMLSPSHIQLSACSLNAVSIAISSTMRQLFAPGVVLGLPSFPYTVEDYPKYHWRGLMIDVSRHFQPVALLKRCVEAMQLSKLNVLHLHLTDAQSFPLALEDRPGLPLSLLANKGSWDSVNKVYNTADLKELVSFARLHGIEIIPEVDVPAHTFAWGKAFPGIVVNCSHRASVSETPMDIYALDPSNALTYKVVEEVYKQIADIFPSKYMHIGGDEVDVRCWQESPALQEWARQQGNLTEIDMFAGFVNRTMKHVRSLGKVPISWQGVLDSGSLPKEPDQEHSSIVQPWKCWAGLSIRASNSAIKSKHPVVMSSCWYLDYDTDWLSMMSVDQLATAISKNAASNDYNRLALGGEGAMWTERVDHTNLECRMWPRAAAIASRLWGLNDALLVQTHNVTMHNILEGQAALLDLNTSKSLLISLVHFRNILINIGVKASPIVFHKNVRAKGVNGFELTPEGSTWSERKAIEVIRSQVHVGLTMSSNNKLQPTLVEGAYRLTCKCLSASKNMAVQRPHHMKTVHIAQLNVADGRLGTIEYPLTDWLVQKANEGLLLIGLCEINNWHKLKSSTDVNKNMPLIEYYASQSGFTYSHVMVNSQPYNLGLISSVSFEVYGEYGQPDFQRGLLHVYVKSLDLHVMVLHLHAHSSQLRTLECQKVASLLRPFLANNSRVVLMGDMNTLSPLDASQHEEMGLLSALRRKTHEVWVRLGKKFLSIDQSKIDYTPMATILSTGMLDSCAVGCNLIEGNTTKNAWSMKRSSAFAMCMQKQCAATEPTRYSSEWPKLPDDEKHPFVRLDYILVSPAVVRDARKSRLGVFDDKTFDAFVEVTNATQEISDHFPMEVRWAEKNGYDLF